MLSEWKYLMKEKIGEFIKLIFFFFGKIRNTLFTTSDDNLLHNYLTGQNYKVGEVLFEAE